MRIIKEGKIDSLEYTCDKCGCVFEYIDSDIKHEWSDPDLSDLIGGTAYYEILKCPYCGEELVVKSNFTPYEHFSFSKWIKSKFKKQGDMHENIEN